MKTILKLLVIFFLVASCQKEKIYVPKVGNVKVSKLTQTSVYLEASMPNGTQRMGFILDDLSNEREVYCSYQSGLAKTNIYFLEPGTKYFIKAFSEIKDKKYFSDVVEITSLSDGNTLAAESISFYEATLKGELNLVANMPVDYYFAYGINNFQQKTEVKTVTGEGSLIVEEKLSNLVPGRQYQFKLMLRVDGKEFSTNSLKFKTTGDKAEISHILINIPDTTKISVSARINTNLLETELKLQYYKTKEGLLGSTTIVYGMIMGEAVNINIDFPVNDFDSYTFIISAQNEAGTSTVDSSLYSAAFVRDGVVYKAVPIGSFWFMTENYRGTKFNNGDDIPYIVEDLEWNQLSTAGMAYYNHSDSLAKEFGALYNWYALADERGMAPAGWRLPSDEDIFQLFEDLGEPLGRRIGGMMKETGDKYWFPVNVEASNVFGFNGRASGYRDADGGPAFEELGQLCPLWTGTDCGVGTQIWKLHFMYDILFVSDIANYHNGNGVRFIKDR